MSHRGAFTIRTALFRIFIQPTLSTSNITCQRGARAFHRSTRHGYAYMNSDRIRTMQRSRLIIKPEPAKIHPDLVVSDYYHTVSAISAAGEFSRTVPVRELRARIAAENESEGRVGSGSEQLLIWMKQPKWAKDAVIPNALMDGWQRANPLATRIPTHEEVDLYRRNCDGWTVVDGRRIKLPTMPAWRDDALVKVYTKSELYRMQKNAEQIEKKAAKVANAEKELEVTWTIEPHDLVWGIKKMKAWIIEGKRVKVTMTRKKKWVEPPAAVCENLIQSLREAVVEAIGGDEKNIVEDQDGKVGANYSIQFQPKANAVAAMNTRTTTADTVITLPWLVGKGKLKQELKALAQALKKGKAVLVELTDEEADKGKGAITRAELYSQVRSTARQCKDISFKSTSGTLDSTMSILIQGGYTGANKELEICPDSTEKDVSLRIGWIDEDMIRRNIVTVWAGATPREGLEAELRKRFDGKAEVTKMDEVEDDVTVVKFIVDPSNAPKPAPLPKVEAFEPTWNPQSPDPSLVKRVGGRKSAKRNKNSGAQALSELAGLRS